MFPREQISNYQDHNEVIGALAKCYPAAFFANPRLRLPLKPEIEKDMTRWKSPG